MSLNHFKIKRFYPTSKNYILPRRTAHGFADSALFGTIVFKPMRGVIGSLFATKVPAGGSLNSLF